MAQSALDTRPPAGDRSDVLLSEQRAPFALTLALTVTLGVGFFLVVMSLVWILHPPHHLSGLFAAGGDQNQTTKTALYLLAFVIILPVSVLAVPRLADLVGAGANRPALPALAGGLAGALAAAILLVKLSGALGTGDGTPAVLAAVGAWAVAAGVLVARAAQPRPFRTLLRLAPHWRMIATVAALLVFSNVLCVVRFRSVSLTVIVVGALVVVGALLVLARGGAVPRLPRRGAVALDLAVMALILLAVPDLVVFATGLQIPSWLTRAGVIQFHHDFLLGPTNQLRGGRALLVDSPVSQYGVGSIYFLAAWFKIAPIGYGTYALLDGALTALFYVSGYCVLRLARVPWVLATAAAAVGVIALVYNYAYPVGGIPQQGPLRFGLPMAALLMVVAGAHWSRYSRLARVGGFVVLGIASVWALEAFAYTVVTLAATTCFEASQRPSGSRRRWLGRQALLAVAACAGAHLLLVAATLVATGSLPDWGQYLAFVRTFLLGGNSATDITYGFARWSPGLAVGAAYLASAAAIVLLIRRRPDVTRRDETTLLAASGVTAYGIALFSYFDNRSATFLLLYVALPAVMLAALWLTVVLGASPPRSTRLGAVGFVLAVAVLLIAAAWPSASDRFPDSALGHIFPEGRSLPVAVKRLWRPPPIDPRAAEGVRLLRRYMPNERRSIVLVSPDLGIEILVRSGRTDRLGFGDPIEDSFVTSTYLPATKRIVAQIEPGERLLMSRATVAALAKLRANPRTDPLDIETPAVAPLQRWVLRRLDQRFRLRPIDANDQGFSVVQLDPRSGAASGPAATR